MSILPYDSRIVSFGFLEEKMNSKRKGVNNWKGSFSFAEEK